MDIGFAQALALRPVQATHHLRQYSALYYSHGGCSRFLLRSLRTVHSTFGFQQQHQRALLDLVAQLDLDLFHHAALTGRDFHGGLVPDYLARPR